VRLECSTYPKRNEFWYQQRTAFSWHEWLGRGDAQSGWTAETEGRQRSGSTSWEADDVDAQVGYYSDFFGAIRSDTVGSFPTAIESVAGETRMLLDASQAA
jgi:hypothetical protein